MIWFNETPVVLRELDIQPVIWLKDGRYDESCLTYRYNEAMKFIFWDDLGCFSEKKYCLLKWSNTQAAEEQNHLGKEHKVKRARQMKESYEKAMEYRKGQRIKAIYGTAQYS